MKKTIFLATAFVAVTAGAQTFDITGYCTEMASKQGHDYFWKERCIRTLEVQQKYMEKYRRDLERQTRQERWLLQNEWINALMKARRIEKEGTPEEAAMAAARVDQLMEQCVHIWSTPSDCPEFRQEFDASRRK